MTDKEWGAAGSPRPMLRYLLGPDRPRVKAVAVLPTVRCSDRKLRLFACACYRRVGHLLPDPRARAAVEVAEQVADGLLPAQELRRAEGLLRQALDALEARWRAAVGAEHLALLPAYEALALGLVVLRPEAQKAAHDTSINAYLAAASLTNPDPWPARKAEERAQTDLLRCLFGNPLRSHALEPAWATSTVTALAEGIYADRAFDRMPILADALEDAGCDNADVLAHCRGDGPHARGCWVVDLILGLE